MAKSEDLFRVGVVLTPGFSLMAFASLVEPLRGANMVSGKMLYQWRHLSPEGGTVASGGGLEVLTEPLPRTPEAELDMLVICGGIGGDSYRNARLNVFLRRVIRHDIIVGSLSTASFILDSIPQVGWLHPYLITHNWLAFGDLLRDPISWTGVEHGIYVAVAYGAVFWLLSWARFGAKDVTS